MDKSEIKKYIQKNIEDEQIEDAEGMIDQYKNIYGYDDEIASMEAIKEIYNSNYDKAMLCVQNGLKYNIFSSDLYFTMGNIYELIGKYNNAYLCYEHALALDMKNGAQIIETVHNLKDNYAVKVNSYSIVILTHNKLEYTKVCLDSIKKYNGNDGCEIIVVDNGSTDGTREYLSQLDDIKCIFNDKNKGFPAGCNQGIEMAKKDNDIFLLNNDTVIMPNSILNLRMGLYSDEKVGAAGSISNNVSNFQKVYKDFKDFDESYNFAMENNITDYKSYESRVKLVGFAMLIKREVLSNIGLLDERFTPGNYEDDDLSVRIIESGNKLLLCKDSYIHHFGSISFKDNAKKYNDLLATNSQKFYDKWGFKDLDICFLRYDYLDEIEKHISSPNQNFNILDIGCGLGGTDMLIKEIYPNACIYGLEDNKRIIDIARNIDVFDSVGQIGSSAFNNIEFDLIMLSKPNMNKYSNEINGYISDKTVAIGFDGLKNQKNIQFTGERMVINDFVRENYNDIMQEHLERYKLASNFVKDKVVVDAACGTGYGTILLADSGAKKIIGFDISEEAVNSAKVNYPGYRNVDFVVGDATKLNLPDSSVDVFVSFETIEHIDCGSDLIKEASRVLKDDGLFIVSTPNRNVTNPGSLREEQPLNKYHVYEYTPLEFTGDLLKSFSILDLYGQTVEENTETVKNSVLRQITGKNKIDFSKINKIYDHKCRHISEFVNLEPMYMVSICRKKNKVRKEEYQPDHKEVQKDLQSEAGVKFYSLGNDSYIGEKFTINNPSAISIGKNVFIKDSCWLNDCLPNVKNNDFKIIISDGCDIGSRFSISVSNKCIIEKNVIIGPNVYIADCEHVYKNVGIPIMNQGITSTTNEVVIGANSWIGINAVIVGNVKIGKGCVIGANTYVTHNVPDYSVVVGSPAKIIKMYDTVKQDWIKVSSEQDIESVLENRRKMPLISICIPTYNRAAELDKCLNSIFSQIGNDSLFEILISNNNSTDDTEMVVEKYKNLFDNITYYINEENVGADRNVQRVTEKAKGKYIFLHGDDDYFVQDTIYPIMDTIAKNPKKSLYFINVINNKNTVEEHSGLNEFLNESSIGSGFMSSIIMRKEDFLKVKEPFKFIDSCFNQIYLQYMMLLENPDFIVINRHIFMYEGNDPKGYNFGQVFIKNYLDILNYFVPYGLKKENIKEDMKKMLLSTILPWFKKIHDNNIAIDMEGFEKYFCEYYKDEAYFTEALDIFAQIKDTAANKQ